MEGEGRGEEMGGEGKEGKDRFGNPLLSRFTPCHYILHKGLDRKTLLSFINFATFRTFIRPLAVQRRGGGHWLNKRYPVGYLLLQNLLTYFHDCKLIAMTAAMF